ncbi:hypothetical protein KBC03_03530 [Patescibacteria group bacterium]|nr:hypothetical protein [Patescibacteria group bacterium]
MTPAEISASIKAYLKDKVVGINTQLVAENTKAASYYAANGKAYDNLSSIDQFATPKGRNYNLLPETFFIDSLGNETIDSVANILYRQNL